MVAKIVIGKSIRGILHYNEQKVSAGEADLILASGFGMDIPGMAFIHKITRFSNLILLHPQVKTNALHISLNFHSDEKLDNTKMQQIALDYMERIGFGDQPFLVYRHRDAAHHHVHIATVSIRPDGTAINLHNIGRTLSEPARTAIEEKFGLMKAEEHTLKTAPAIKPVDLQKVAYGHIPTKRAISNVATAVYKTYAFTSLAEYNAILGQFNVTASRGNEDTEMYRKKGLVYSLINAQGEKVGIPIKSSSLYSKPTLPGLEKKFGRNAEKRKAHRDDLKQRIGKVMDGFGQFTKTTFLTELAKQGIHTVFRQNEQGTIYGITYVDNTRKTVFNGSDLGKEYSAKAITGKLAHTDIATTKQSQQQETGDRQQTGAKAQRQEHGKRQQQKTYLTPSKPGKSYLQTPDNGTRPPKTYLKPAAETDLLNALFTKTTPDYGPYTPLKKKKRRKGHGQQINQTP